jgi:transcriptional regulator with XRE-family HTH domain
MAGNPLFGKKIRELREDATCTLRQFAEKVGISATFLNKVAYVKYIVYVHGLYQKIQAGPAHGVGD